MYELEHMGGIITYSNIEISNSLYVNCIRYTQSTSAITFEGTVITAPSTITIASNASSVPSAGMTITLYY